LLAAQSVSGVFSKLGVPVVGPSAGKSFLAYLLLWYSGSFTASLAVVLIKVHRRVGRKGKGACHHVDCQGMGFTGAPN